MVYNYPNQAAYPTPQMAYPTQPVTYPYYVPSYVAPQQTAPAAPTPTNQPKLDFVSGRTAADVYNVNVGEEAILIDIDNPCIYKKSRSLDNKLDMQVFDLTPHVDAPAPEYHQVNLDEYMKADAITQLVNDTVKKEVEEKLSEISFAPKSSRRTSKGEE